jgi:hypothetical protein
MYKYPYTRCGEENAPQQELTDLIGIGLVEREKLCRVEKRQERMDI